MAHGPQDQHVDDNEVFTAVIVDDSPMVRRLLTRGLEKNGRFRVIGEAADGDEAVALLGAAAPDALVLDLSMPNRGGLDVLPELRRALPATVVAVFSSVGPDVLGKLVWRAGADLYVQKTGRLDDFIADLLTELTVQRSTVPS